MVIFRFARDPGAIHGVYAKAATIQFAITRKPRTAKPGKQVIRLVWRYILCIVVICFGSRIGRFLVGGLVITASDLLAFQAISWSSSVNGLRLGLRLQMDGAHSLVLVFLQNVDSIRKGVFVSLGLVKRIDFIAVAPDGRQYTIRQRAEYQPCAGLCHWPLIDNLGPGQTRRLEFATKDLIYIPERAPITELETLLSRGHSIRAPFTVTDKDLSQALNEVEDSWRGRIVSPRIRIP